MLQKPCQIEFIGFTDGFADHWTIGVDWGYRYETITSSDNPSHPQGVFFSTMGDYTFGSGKEKYWKDLPETLQKFLINYISEIEKGL